MRNPVESVSAVLDGDTETPMVLRKFKLLMLLAGAALIVCGAYFIGVRQAGDSAREISARQLQIMALDLEATLERFETLPFTLSFHPDAVQTLAHPDDAALIARFNLTLKAIQGQAKVAAIYLMDASGKTLATSNWDTTQDYTGRNFGFRPYFLDALQGGAGRFYGIGSTTNEPGYFIAQPVYAGGAQGKPVGVIAVKISLDDFARTWRKIEEPVALADRWGVIFLSNRPAWRYHSLDALGTDTQRDIFATKQYMGQDLLPLKALPASARQEFAGHVAQPVSRLGWQLMIFPAQKSIARSASLWAMAAAVLLAAASVAWWAAHQRKRRLEERVQARQAMLQAAEDLEQKIIIRTAELTKANHSIAAKYTKLKETEHLLRNTQNELVQAGKLTMLGQMAAGVTHELSQPLTAIRAFADNARTFLARGQMDPAVQNLSHISAASERMGAIIGQLKGFARKSDAAVVPVDLAQSIRTSALLLENDFARAGARLQIDIEHAAQVTGDAVRIEQVLINLMRNALDAVQDCDNKSVQLVLSCDGDDALVRIRDSGAGIPDDVAAHLFEPFFTTKPTGAGLGLGLAISSSIVQAMNGRLEAHNQPGGGAEFSLWLPLVLARIDHE
jgi:two-component system C4-dicarboxylate transport sensor histidine kinase DctB